MRRQFLEGAEVVQRAVSHPGVAEAWDQDSFLDGQTVGSLASHLARGAVWVVGEYLDGDVGERPVDFGSAAEYFSVVGDSLTEADHVAIRKRGAAVAVLGAATVAADLASAVDALSHRLPVEPADRRVAVFAGKVMRLDDYLWTRIVEQVVHLDDLSRSIGVEPWPIPADSAALVVACGAEIGRRRFGDTAMIRALYRDGDPSPLPVL